MTCSGGCAPDVTRATVSHRGSSPSDRGRVPRTPPGRLRPGTVNHSWHLLHSITSGPGAEPRQCHIIVVRTNTM
jgi:hypothetical protein